MSYVFSPKHPSDVLDYKFDFKAETNGSGREDVLAVGETISSRTVTVPAGITKNSDSITDSNTSVTVWLSGGTADTDYDVLCAVTTSVGRTFNRTGTVPVRSL